MLMVYLIPTLVNKLVRRARHRVRLHSVIQERRRGLRVTRALRSCIAGSIISTVLLLKRIRSTSSIGLSRTGKYLQGTSLHSRTLVRRLRSIRRTGSRSDNVASISEKRISNSRILETLYRVTEARRSQLRLLKFSNTILLPRLVSKSSYVRHRAVLLKLIERLFTSITGRTSTQCKCILAIRTSLGRCLVQLQSITTTSTSVRSKNAKIDECRTRLGQRNNCLQARYRSIRDNLR